MSSIMDLLNTMIMCMTLLVIAFMVVLALPQSKMREVVKNGLLAVGCVIYVLSPIDFIPEIALGPLGAIDDVGAVVVGVVAAKKALKEVRE